MIDASKLKILFLCRFATFALIELIFIALIRVVAVIPSLQLFDKDQSNIFATIVVELSKFYYIGQSQAQSRQPLNWL